MSTSITDRRISSAGPPPTASRKSVSPVKQRSPTTNETPSSEWPGVASGSIRRPPVATGAGRDLEAEALDELVVARDVVGVAVRDEQMRRREPLALDRLEQRLERRAAVDEDGRSAGLVRDRYAFESQDGCMLRSTIMPRIVRRIPRRAWRIARGPSHRTDRGRHHETHVFAEREVLEEAADRWWLFLADRHRLARLRAPRLPVGLHDRLGDLVSSSASSRSSPASNEFLQISVSTTGWKLVHGLLGVLFILVGIYALWHPYDTFATLAALVGLFLLVKGIFDITVAFITKDEFELWWLQLVVGLLEILLAFWVAGNFREKAILLVVYVGIIALVARDHRDLRRVQAQGPQAAARRRLRPVSAVRNGVRSPRCAASPLLLVLLVVGARRRCARRGLRRRGGAAATPETVEGTTTETTETETTETETTETDETETTETDETTETETTDRRPSRAIPSRARRSSSARRPAAGATRSPTRVRRAGRPEPRRREAERELVVDRVTNGQGAMPSFSSTLSEQQIADVAAYVSSVAGS